MNYTKGKWYIWHTNNAGDIIQTTNRQIATIVGAYGWDEKSVKECTANANLISASPDMYEALKEAKKVMDSFYNAMPVDTVKLHAQIATEKALAKAEGR